jgi:hypothetical protein
MMSCSVLRRVVFWLMALLIAPAFVACGAAIDAAEPLPTVTINPAFQTKIAPIPTMPPYRCGAWASTNAPGADATITIYARLTHAIQGVSGKQASATVHFQNGDFTINQPQISDSGGYVSFTLRLQGRQPVKVPATIDVTFASMPGGSLKCSPAFFTPA